MRGPHTADRVIVTRGVPEFTVGHVVTSRRVTHARPTAFRTNPHHNSAVLIVIKLGVELSCTLRCWLRQSGSEVKRS
jgi:hypothetical protein